MTAVITYGLLAAVLVSQLRGRARYVPPVIAAIIIMAVGFSRIYLGVHYLTDVLAGTLVAGACLILAIAALSCSMCGKRHPRVERTVPGGFLFAAQPV